MHVNILTKYRGLYGFSRHIKVYINILFLIEYCCMNTTKNKKILKDKMLRQIGLPSPRSQSTSLLNENEFILISMKTRISFTSSSSE